ncbi:MAG: DUF4835 family protein, partial [bacterium]
MKKSTSAQVLIVLLGSLALLALSTEQSMAQKLVAQLNQNTEKLTQESKDKLVSLTETIEQYINDFDWCDNSKRYTIPMQIDIFFEKAEATSFEDRYDARIVISSNKADFQASDKRWRFPYQISERLTHAEQFHPLTGILDFYIYQLLGQEFDRLKKLGGDTHYQKAKQIAELSKFSEFYQWGWKERVARIDSLLSETQIPLREL